MIQSIYFLGKHKKLPQNWMKFTVSQSEFSKALLTSGKSVLSRANLPILSNILIKAAGNSVEILATDLETATKVNLKCKVVINGETTVNGKTLLEFISQVNEGDVVVEKLGEEVVVSAKGYSARFNTMPPEEFPAIPKIEKGVELELETTQFINAVNKTVFSAAQDEGRPILTGVLCDIAKNKMKMVATDGYRLGYEEIQLKDTKNIPSMKINVPAKALGEVAKILSELGALEDSEKEEGNKQSFNLLIANGLNQMSFRLDGVEFTSRLIEGEFPNWQKIIPSTFNTKVRVNKEEFAKLVKVASIFARDSGNIIKLKFESKGNKLGALNVTAASSQVGSGDASCEVEMEGKGGEIAFNYRYLLEILGVVVDEDINFEMNESLNPGKITSTNSKETFFHIVMPVRLQS